MICKSDVLFTSFHNLSNILNIYVISGFDLSIEKNNFLQQFRILEEDFHQLISIRPADVFMNSNIVFLKTKNNESLILNVNESQRLLYFCNNYYKKLNTLVKFKTLINKNKFSYTYFFIYFFFINKILMFQCKIYKKTFVIFHKEFLFYFFAFLTR